MHWSLQTEWQLMTGWFSGGLAAGLGGWHPAPGLAERPLAIAGGRGVARLPLHVGAPALLCAMCSSAALAAERRGPAWLCGPAGGCDGQLRLWDIRRAGPLHVFDQHQTQEPPAPPRPEPPRRRGSGGGGGVKRQRSGGAAGSARQGGGGGEGGVRRAGGGEPNGTGRQQPSERMFLPDKVGGAGGSVHRIAWKYRMGYRSAQKQPLGAG